MNTQPVILNQENKTALVCKLNDTFRRNVLDRRLGTLLLTAGVAALKHEDITNIIEEVQCFEDFNEDNDPYGEHDFGAFNYHGQKYFFKIDYYAKGTSQYSKDEANPDITNRVLTIMHASEY